MDSALFQKTRVYTVPYQLQITKPSYPLTPPPDPQQPPQSNPSAPH